MKEKTTVNPQEVAKFAELCGAWWNTEGPLKTLHDINPARIKFMQKFTALAGKSVLDVGCGGGILSEGMAKLGANVTGIDAEKEAITAARLHAEQSDLNIQYQCTPIEDYHSECFDVVSCMEMLEHVTEPQLVIEHCARLVKPGGYVFFSTINRTLAAYAGAVVAAEYLLNLLPRQTHDYDKFIKPSELAAMVRSENMDVIGLDGMSYNPLTRHASLQKSVQINYLMACRK